MCGCGDGGLVVVAGAAGVRLRALGGVKLFEGWEKGGSSVLGGGETREGEGRRGALC